MSRLLVITTSYPSDNDDCAGHFVRAEVTRALAEGHALTVIAPRAARALAPESHAVIGLTHLGAFGSPGALTRLRKRPDRWLGAFIFVMTARATMRKLGPFDRTLAHFLVPSLWPIATTAKGPVEVVVHGSDLRLFERLPSALKHWILRPIRGQQLSFRCVSQELAGRLKAQLPKHENIVIRVEPSLIDVPELPGKAELRRKLGVGVSEPLVVIVSRLVKGKRVEVALRAAAAAPNVNVVVCGDGPERQMLAREFPRVHFCGQVPRLRALEWIAASDLVTSASRDEGAPTVVREARALGVPVVATNAGDLAAWAQRDPGIFVANQDQDQDLKRLLLQVLNQKQ